MTNGGALSTPSSFGLTHLSSCRHIFYRHIIVASCISVPSTLETGVDTQAQDQQASS